MPQQILAPVLSVTPIITNHYVLTCHAPAIAAEARPGHFLNARINDEGFDPLLRKPFSVYTADPAAGTIAILFSVVGAVTRGMARKRPGDTLDIVAPLGGRLFVPDPRPDCLHIMVGGGYGVPPLVFLSRTLLEADPSASLAFITGARTRDLLLCQEELSYAGVPLHPATDDGSHGKRGLVTDVLGPLLNANSHRPVHIYCCGPTPMMRAVAAECLRFSTPCQLSVEVPMPCGVGVCMGCVLDLTDGRRVRCCVDGPVFEAKDVQWP